MIMPKIDLGDIYLREIEFDDYKDLFDITSKEEVCRYLTYYPLRKIKEAIYMMEEFYLKRDLHIPNAYAIINKENEKMIGVVEYHTYHRWDNAYEVGYILNPKYQGLGIMHRAFKALIDVGFNYLSINKIIAGSVVDNKKSINLIKKLNFNYDRLDKLAFEAKDGSKKDIAYYSLDKTDYERMMNNG